MNRVGVRPTSEIILSGPAADFVVVDKRFNEGENFGTVTSATHCHHVLSETLHGFNYSLEKSLLCSIGHIRQHSIKTVVKINLSRSRFK